MELKIFKSDEIIQSYEYAFLILFSVGLLSFVNWLTMQYPYVGLTLAAMGVLLLWLAKMVRKKKAKQAAQALGYPGN
jgi:Flp pilus assembly protein TadB